MPAAWGMDQEIPDYDMDSEDEHWLNKQTKKMEVSPLKRVLLRTMPELAAELESVVNVFDPWARDRGEYYSLAWKPRPGAESDEAFRE